MNNDNNKYVVLCPIKIYLQSCAKVYNQQVNFDILTQSINNTEYYAILCVDCVRLVKLP